MADRHLDDQLAQQLENDLVGRFGILLGSTALAKSLGYPSMQAYHQALTRNLVPVPVFEIEHRRGRFALAKEVAYWLARQRQTAGPSMPAGPGLAMAVSPQAEGA